MPVSTITCPHCSTTFKSKTPVPEGTRLKCPKCTQPFVVPGAAPAAPPKPSPAAVVPKPAAAAPQPAAPKPSAATPKPSAEEDMLEATEIIDDESDDVVEIADGDDAGSPAATGGGLAAKFPFLKRFPMWVWLTGGGVALLLLCGGCGGVGWLAWSWLGGGSVTKANLDKIKKDMTDDQVKAILGAPSLSGDVGSVKSETWKNGDDFITIGFLNGKAVSSAYELSSGGVKMTGGGSLP